MRSSIAPTLVTHVLPPRRPPRPARGRRGDRRASSRRSCARTSRELGISSRDRIAPRSESPDAHAARSAREGARRRRGRSRHHAFRSRARACSRRTRSGWWLPRSLTELPGAATARFARARARAHRVRRAVARGAAAAAHRGAPHRVCAPGRARVRRRRRRRALVEARRAVRAERRARRFRAGRRRCSRSSPLTSPRRRVGRSPSTSFIGALARAELRVAFLLTGDCSRRSTSCAASTRISSTRPNARASARCTAYLEHPFAGDVCRYALTPRRRRCAVGSGRRGRADFSRRRRLQRGGSPLPIALGHERNRSATPPSRWPRASRSP